MMRSHCLVASFLACFLVLNQVVVINAGPVAKEYPYCNNIFDPSISCTNIKDGTYSNPQSSCSSIFFYCSNGKSYCYECQPGLYYNFFLERCDFFNAVPACAAGPEPTTTKTTVTPSTTMSTTTAVLTTTVPTATTTKIVPTVTAPGGGIFFCPADKPNGFFHIPNTCGRDYFSCVSGYPYVLQCPGTAVFDPLSLICVPEAQASCKVGNLDCFGKPDGFHAIPGQCTANYHICISGTTYVQGCPGQALFDPVKLICVPELDASCKP